MASETTCDHWKVFFFMRKSEKKGPNFLGPLLPILRLTFLESFCNFRQFGLKNDGYFFIGRVFRTHVACDWPVGLFAF